MRRKASQSPNKLMKLIALPFRALVKARDVYVRGLTACAGRVTYAAPGGPIYSGSLPRSFSAASSRSGHDSGGEDFRELLRAASAKSLGADVVLRHEKMLTARRGSARLPKSCSVGMGRIDEDEECEFGDGEDEVCYDGRRMRSTDVMYRRSRSHAVGNKSVF